MNLNHLEYLVSVARNGSINRAAKELLVSQPYLSGTIRNIEKEMGIQIFRRTSTGIEPTELGEEFLKCTERVLAEIEQMRSLGETGVQSLKLASCYSPYFIKCFLDMRASSGSILHDSFQEMPMQAAFRALSLQTVNLALVAYAEYAKEYYAQKAESFHCVLKDLIPCVPFSVMMRKGHPLEEKDTVSLEDLHNYPFVYFGDKDALSLVRSIGLGAYPGLITISDRGSYFDFMRSGDYLTIMPIIAGGRPVHDEMSYRPLTGTEVRMSFSYAVREQYKLNAREREFLKYVRDHSILAEKK